jgi:hypothetical protein
VDDPVWRFGRREERLTLRRETKEEGVALVVTENGTPRSFLFSNLDGLAAFQSDMEAFLVRSGWSLLEYSPDRRSGRDRRGFPRLTERRRWWTDGLLRSALDRLPRMRRHKS